ALNKEKGPLPSFKPAKSGGGTQKKLRKAKPEGEQLFLFDDKLRSEAHMFKLTKPSILADRLLPVVVRRLKHRGIWGRKRKRENKGYLPNMKTSKRMSMALYIYLYIELEARISLSYKKLLLQLLPIRNDPVHHAEKYPTPPAVYSGKHGSVSILNLYSSTLPPLTRYLHLLEEQVLPANIHRFSQHYFVCTITYYWTQLGDCTTKHYYSDNSFTVIYSRDTILDIQVPKLYLHVSCWRFISE
ncbi:LOW QUALITY PROTEIN: hypothetical protein HID58_059743, partial [Brassica napus]